MNDKEILAEIEKQWHGNFRSYILGGIFSFLLTVASFLLVGMHLFSKPVRLILLFILALSQVTVQMHYFLHIGKDSKPHFRTLIFVFMIFVLLILVFGSLWIMHNLNERVM